MRYAMLITGPAVEAPMGGSPEEADAAMQEVYAWFEKWGAAGKIADGGAELDSVATAKTARYADGQPKVTDGPYVELKEVIGGVVFLQGDSIDEAMEVAATWPGLREPGHSVEVRPIIEH